MSEKTPLPNSIDFESILLEAPDAVVIHDLENRVVFWNLAAEKLYGWSSDEIIGQPIKDIFYRDDAVREEAMQELSALGVWSGELCQMDRNGDEYYVNVRQQLQCNTEGEPTAVVSFNTDVTSLREQAYAAERAYHIRSSSILVGKVAHELNNALAPIMLSTVMLKRLIENEKALNMIGMIEKCADKSAGLVRELLDFERGRGGSEVDFFNGNQIRKALDSICLTKLDQAVRCQINLADDLWKVRGKIEQVKTVFEHVIQNSCEAMPEGGQIKIDVTNCLLDECFERFLPGVETGAYVNFVFIDTGIGIAPEDLAHVAEPFFTTKSPAKGYGFGLSKAQAVVKGHKGFMIIESEVGKGCTLRLFLPADAGTLSSAETEELLTRSGNGELILVADDEMHVRSATKNALEECGYTVVVAKDGYEALELYKSRKDEFAMVVTNIEMPLSDGLSLSRNLRSLDSSVKILVSSGFQSTDLIQEIKSLGVSEFLTKPYTAKSLVDRIHKILTNE